MSATLETRMPFLDNEDISFDSLYGGVVANDLINIAMMSRSGCQLFKIVSHVPKLRNK